MCKRCDKLGYRVQDLSMRSADALDLFNWQLHDQLEEELSVAHVMYIDSKNNCLDRQKLEGLTP